MFIQRLLLILFLFFICLKGPAQNSFIPDLGRAIVPEHGFLKGKKFKIYPTIGKYNFSGRKIRLELYDNRESLKLILINCSYVEMNNLSEFNGEKGFLAVQGYFQKLFSDAGIIIDSMSKDTLKVELEALDSRLIGFGSITAHGLCQMAITYKKISKSYCIDITDKDKHSPIGRNALVTRMTATRVITSAAIREIIEQFLIDVKSSAN